MVQHLLHIQNLVTPEICYNTRRFRRSVSPLGASGSGFGIFQPPPIQTKGFADGNLRNRLGVDYCVTAGFSRLEFVSFRLDSSVCRWLYSTVQKSLATWRSIAWLCHSVVCDSCDDCQITRELVKGGASRDTNMSCSTIVYGKNVWLMQQSSGKNVVAPR